MRRIRHNIFKARKITQGVYLTEEKEIRNVYNTLDLAEVLKRQNDYSRNDVEGIICVLNTSVFFYLTITLEWWIMRLEKTDSDRDEKALSDKKLKNYIS